VAPQRDEIFKQKVNDCVEHIILQKSTNFHAIRISVTEFSEYLQWDRMAGGPVFFAPPCTASHLANRCPAGISQSSRLSMISRCILKLLVANWESQLKGQRTRTAAADEYTKCIIMFYNHYQKINKISAHYLRSHAHNLTLTIKSSFYYNCNCIYTRKNVYYN